MQWQQKLYQYTEDPPVEIWEALKSELGKEPYHLRNTLEMIEEPPPPDAWQNIKSGLQPDLSEQQATPLAPVVRMRPTRIYTYAAVVAATVLIISTLIYLIRTDNEGLNPRNITTSIGTPESRKTNNLSVSYSDTNYILVPSPEGGYNRVSYKLHDMVKCMYGEQPDIKIKQRWNNTITRWKQKMEQSKFMPSGANFFDMAEMAAVIDEK